MVKFLLILLVLGLLMRFVLPLLIRLVISNLLKKQARRFGQQFGTPFEAPRPEARTSRPTASGEVQVDYVPPRQKTAQPKQFNGGEYVDYEDVK